ncbi:MAG: hypothetical protein WBL39_09255 [Terrimicrobiaceae bacterium]
MKQSAQCVRRCYEFLFRVACLVCEYARMHCGTAASILLWLFTLVCPGCAGRPLVDGFLDSQGTIYRQSEREDFGSRTTIGVRSFEF